MFFAALGMGVLGSIVLTNAVGNAPATYESSATLLIDQPLAIAQSGDQSVLDKLIRLRLKYASLVKTDVMSAPVSEELNQPLIAVESALFAVAKPDSLLMTVGARTRPAKLTRDLAQAAAEETVTFAQQEQVIDHIPAGQRFVFRIVVPAGPPTKISPTGRRSVEVGTAGGLLLFAGILGGSALFRRSP